MNFSPQKIWIDRSVEEHPCVRRILERLSGVPTETVDDVQTLKRPYDFSKAKRELILTTHRGTIFKSCQGMPNFLPFRAKPAEDGTAGEVEESLAANAHQESKRGQALTFDMHVKCQGLTPVHLCCNYYILDLTSGCPMDCSYCILQHYLANNPITTVFVNLEDAFAEIDAFCAAHPDQHFRIGTGELADSLALDPITGFSEELIRFFAAQPRLTLELKTKTDFVDHLLDLPHAGRTVIAWSVNTEAVIAHEERGTASLAARLAAAQRCANAGYRVGFHFDPIVILKGDEEEMAIYEDVIDKICAAVDPAHIAWVSLGLFRFPYSMRAVVQRRFPATRIFSGELVPAGNKMRYPRFLRDRYYRPLWDRLAAHLPQEKIYFCMETPEVWKKFDPQITCHNDLDRRLNSYA